MRFRKFILLCMVCLFFSFNSVVIAQNQDADDEPACSTLVEDALARIDQLCRSIGRNQACYGHTLVHAIGWDNLLLTSFDDPGDSTSILDVALFNLAPLDLDTQTWGLALMALQANLPGTLPGQNVTFIVLGDVQIRSEVPPDDQAVDPVTLEAGARSGINVRSGPGTNYAISGGLAAGETIIVTGRSAVGDWLLFDNDGQDGWVFANLVTVDGDIETLFVVDGQSGPLFNAPMQAFRLTTGIGNPACEAAPPDGVLVQAPRDTTVHFRINGIQVTIGSTAFLTASDETQLHVSTFDGSVTVTSADETQTILPGFSASASEGEPPSQPEPYVQTAVQTLPVQLLPEPVTIPEAPESTSSAAPGGSTDAESQPAVTGTTIRVVVPVAVVWSDSGIVLRAGQRFSISASGSVNVWPMCQQFCTPIPSGPDIPYMIEPLTCAGLCAGVAAGPQGSFIVQGSLSNSGEFPVPNGPLAALVGRVGGGTPFVVGTGGTFTADADGSLYFMVNEDLAYVGDETGEFIAEVTIEE